MNSLTATFVCVCNVHASSGGTFPVDQVCSKESNKYERLKHLFLTPIVVLHAEPVADFPLVHHINAHPTLKLTFIIRCYNVYLHTYTQGRARSLGR